MKKIYIIAIFVFLGFIQSCDKIDNPIKEGVVTWNGRKIIVYDFTGHTCGNCPRAHSMLANMSNLYGDAIIPVAIHCTYYAIPRSSTSSKFYYDFRTDIGDYLGGRDYDPGFYGLLPLPIGLVNNLSADNLISDSSWPTEAAKIISSYPEFSIEINGDFSVSDSIISCNIKTITNLANSRKLSLTAFVLEDKIIEWQKDYRIEDANQRDVENYEHNHVLRAGFNGAWGENIKTDNNQSVINSEISRSYNLKASDKWNINNCSIIAYVYDTDTKEILQAEIIHLSE